MSSDGTVHIDPIPAPPMDEATPLETPLTVGMVKSPFSADVAQVRRAFLCCA